MNASEQFKAFLDDDLVKLAARERTAFDELAGAGNSIVIYGCGNLGRKLAQALRQAGTPAAAFIDGNKTLWGKSVLALPVYGVEEAARLYGKDAVFVVAVWSPGKDRRFEAIKQTLQAAGCNKVVHFLPLFWKHAETLLPHYRLDLPSQALAQKDPMVRAFELLADEPSRAEFLVQLEWMLLGDGGLVPPGEPIGDTYFPADLFRLSGQECFVDCGAFDGDTLRTFLRRTNNSFAGIVAYEPDPDNCVKLGQYVHSLPDELQTKVRIEQCALGSTAGIVRFAAMGSVSSSITADGSIEVALKRLDDTLQDAAPTYIKMDIEGAEIETLRGGQRAIQTFHPKLAACVYHLQDHLWQIPLEMKRLNPDAALYLRRYDDEFGDVVCYSVP
jgi:FkbM family methyltransferase